MNFDKISRRGVLKGTAALTIGSALPVSRALAADTTIGFIYVGSRDDYGYNQAHAAGAAALKKMPGIKVVEEEKVPETDAVEKTMESMINLDGATLLFPTSFGYFDPHMIKMAQKYPKLRFEHCGGLWTDKHPKNAGSYFGYIDEAQHVAGIVAGYIDEIRQARLRRRQADSAGIAQHQCLDARRQARQSEDHHASHLHRRLVDAGEGSRSHQQPDRSGRRRHHLPRRRSEDRGRECRAPRRDGHRLSRQPVGAGAEGLSHRRRVELGSALSALRQDVHFGRDHSELLPRRPEGRDRQGVAVRRHGHAPKRRRKPTKSRRR